MLPQETSVTAIVLAAGDPGRPDQPLAIRALGEAGTLLDMFWGVGRSGPRRLRRLSGCGRSLSSDHVGLGALARPQQIAPPATRRRAGRTPAAFQPRSPTKLPPAVQTGVVPDPVRGSLSRPLGLEGVARPPTAATERRSAAAAATSYPPRPPSPPGRSGNAADGGVRPARRVGCARTRRRHEVSERAGNGVFLGSPRDGLHLAMAIPY